MAEEEKIEQHIIADRTLIRTARIISGILTPFSIPFLAFLVLFLFSYLRIMPLQYKLIVLGIVYCFTILMPTMTIFLFRKVNGFLTISPPSESVPTGVIFIFKELLDNLF